MKLFEGLILQSEKHAVVIDIGYKYSKCGFAGEAVPRHIYPTCVTLDNDENVNLYDIEDKKLLYKAIKIFLHDVFFKYLVISHRDRKVAIVEPLFGTEVFRETLAKVLFVYFEVPAVLFIPNPVSALVTLGIPSGIVIDVGYKEATVIPVYEGEALLNCSQVQPLAAEAIETNLQRLVRNRCKLRQEDGTEVAVCDTDLELDQWTVEDLLVRLCFVSPFDRARRIADNLNDLATTEPPKPPPGVEYPFGGNKILLVDGSVREAACEVMYEVDGDMVNLATMVLDAVSQCPIDTRTTLLENLVIIGGTSMLPGFKARLLAEIRDFAARPAYASRFPVKSVKHHKLPGKENFIAWLGGAIMAATEAISLRGLSRDQYLQGVKLQDWARIASTSPESERKL